MPQGARPVDLDDKHILQETPGRYSIKKEHGRGNIGRVLIALDEQMEREVALKELLPDSDSGGSAAEPSPLRVSARAAVRFLREAKITCQLEHPGIVPVYEIGRRQDGAIYYTMRLVRGKTLAEKLKYATDLPSRLFLINNFLDLCQAVAYAHSKGVMHRDLKPENIMVGEFGETVVLDWGWAKKKGTRDERAAELMETTRQTGEAELQETAKPPEEADSLSTSRFQYIGTPFYMSPEQAGLRVDDIDERSDVWALGVILYEILTGQWPFIGKNAFEVMTHIINDPVVQVKYLEPKAPAELCAIAEKCLEKDRNKRYQNAEELAQDLARFQSGGLVSAYDYNKILLTIRWMRRNRVKLSIWAAVVIFVLLTLNPGIFFFYFNIYGKHFVHPRLTEEDMKFLSKKVEQEKLYSLISPPDEPGNAASKIMAATHHAIQKRGKTQYLDSPIPYPWFNKVNIKMLDRNRKDPDFLQVVGWMSGGSAGDGDRADEEFLKQGIEIPELLTFLSAGRLKDYRLWGEEYFPEYGVSGMSISTGDYIPNYLHMIRFFVLGMARAGELEKQGRRDEAHEVLANLLRIGDHLEKDVPIGIFIGRLIKQYAAKAMAGLSARQGDAERAALFTEYSDYQKTRNAWFKEFFRNRIDFLSEADLKMLVDNKETFPGIRWEALSYLKWRFQVDGFRRFFLGASEEDIEFLERDHFEDPGYKFLQWVLVAESQRGLWHRYKYSTSLLIEMFFKGD